MGPAASRALADLIPHSTLHLYPGLGHAAYEESKDFNERVFGFLNDAH